MMANTEHSKAKKKRKMKYSYICKKSIKFTDCKQLCKINDAYMYVVGIQFIKHI